MSEKKEIPIIDLFAGPGGLGEGFSALKTEFGDSAFDIKLSIEKDKYAHQTLLLRSFYRQFSSKGKQIPKEYYEFLRGGSNQIIQFEESFINGYEEEWKQAQAEAWHHELGSNMDLVDQRIKKSLKKESDWVLIGGPPCQAYSIAGRGRVNGIDPKDHRVHLYKLYLEIIAKHAPKVFVMENVRGLLSAKINGESIFNQILEDLRAPHQALEDKEEFHPLAKSYRIFSFVKAPYEKTLWDEPGYEAEDYLIESEKYGIPQKRHRIILLGIRGDVLIDSKLIPYLPIGEEEATVADVISNLPQLRSGLSREADSEKEWKQAILDMDNKEFKRQIREKCIRGDEVWKRVKKTIKTIRSTHYNEGRGKEFIPTIALEWSNQDLADWYGDPNLHGVCNHFARGHMKSDLFRYLFSACYSKVNADSPKLRHYPPKLLPNHKNANTTKFPDRFRTQRFASSATTITSHISKDGHYYIHPDPTQCRSFTVREAARIQTFPDNYYFMGNRTAQYHQVGNAVPPLLANKIARVVKHIMDSYDTGDTILQLENTSEYEIG